MVYKPRLLHMIFFYAEKLPWHESAKLDCSSCSSNISKAVENLAAGWSKSVVAPPISWYLPRRNGPLWSDCWAWIFDFVKSWKDQKLSFEEENHHPRGRKREWEEKKFTHQKKSVALLPDRVKLWDEVGEEESCGGSGDFRIRASPYRSRSNLS